MSIASEITRLQGAKSDIKSAIEAKGVTVSSSLKLDEYASKIGAIPTPIEEAPENDVNFYDYDGFRVASYTIAEAKALTALPTPPQHEGLTFEEWNWSLSDITSYNRQYIDIGANYAPTDGKTHFKVNVSAGYDIMLPIQGRAMTIMVVWGDGNSDDYTYGEGSYIVNKFAHTYASAGKYDIKVTCEIAIINYNWNISWNGAIGQQAIHEINCGTNFSLSINYGLGYLSCQISITKDTPCSLIRGLWCSSIPQINIPNVTPNLSGYYCFQLHNGRISLPKKVSNASSALAQNSTYEKLVMSDFDESVDINSGAFSSMRWAKILSIPNKQFATLSSGQFFQNNNMLKELDVVQGWTPTQSIIFSGSTNWTAETMVKLFGKLGTTTGSITLTFGSTNLNKLTEEQKAIATNKGYTLA